MFKLPDNWFELTTNNGKKYYACITSRHTQWLHPRIPIGIIMPNGLPYGWDKNIDIDSGKVYYSNHIDKFNTWNHPNIFYTNLTSTS